MDLLRESIARRHKLLEKLHSEDTDCYRLFHGTVEGRPGLTVDRYGEQLLVQSFHEPLEAGEADRILRLVNDELGLGLYGVYHDRTRKSKPAEPESVGQCRELGVNYAVCDAHRGQDPLLFLDFRAARRYVLQDCRNLSVLNLFAYTCGIGICAAQAGASEVWNVDFAISSLNFGRRNARLNGLSDDSVTFVHSDFFPAVRQLAGLKVGGRSRNYLPLEQRFFDLVIMDPPRWVRSPFGTVDLVRDYQSVFKPALLATGDGGRMICTNHVPGVALDEWLDLLRRCAAKNGRTIRDIEIIVPEADFPAKDDRHPLKIACLYL